MRKAKRYRMQVQRTPAEIFRVQLVEKAHFFPLFVQTKITKNGILQYLCTFQALQRSPLYLLGTTKIGILSRFMYTKGF